jgi:hypothetical protein
MAKRAFSTLKAELKLRLRNRTDIDSRLDAWTNDAYIDLATGKATINGVQRTFFHRELFRLVTITVSAQTVAGPPQSLVPLPSYSVANDPYDFQFEVFLWNNTKNVPLKKKDVNILNSGARTLSNTAIRYAIYGGVLDIDPTPNVSTVLRMFYYGRPPALSASGDTIVLDDAWEELVLLGAVYRGYDALLEPERARAHQIIYDMQLARRVDTMFQGDKYADRNVTGLHLRHFGAVVR